MDPELKKNLDYVRARLYSICRNQEECAACPLANSDDEEKTGQFFGCLYGYFQEITGYDPYEDAADAMEIEDEERALGKPDGIAGYLIDILEGKNEENS